MAIIRNIFYFWKNYSTRNDFLVALSKCFLTPLIISISFSKFGTFYVKLMDLFSIPVWLSMTRKPLSSYRLLILYLYSTFSNYFMSFWNGSYCNYPLWILRDLTTKLLSFIAFNFVIFLCCRWKYKKNQTNFFNKKIKLK